jgi:hypothetical protein
MPIRQKHKTNMAFSLIHKNKNQPNINKARHFVLLLNGIFFLLFSFYTAQYFTKFSLLMLGLICLASAFGMWLGKIKENPMIERILIILAVIAWTFLIVYPAISVLLIILLVLDLYVFGKDEAVHFTDQQVIIQPKPFSKSHDWSAFNNIIIKDDLLTIDFKNNKIIQLLMDDCSPKMTEEEMNAFFAKHLHKD